MRRQGSRPSGVPVSSRTHDFVVRGPVTEYLMRVERAPRPEAFVSSWSRLRSWITRDTRWWVRVWRPEVPWAVVRERCASEREALVRARELERGLASGAEHVGLWPALRWRDR
jgi:hypothetical protein